MPAILTRNHIVQAFFSRFSVGEGPLQCLGTLWILAACRSLPSQTNHLALPLFSPQHSAPAQVEQRDIMGAPAL